MTDIIRQLRQDHFNIAKLLALLEQQIGLMRKGEEADLGLMVDIMTYMIHYPDQYHHPRENLILARWLIREISAGPLVDAIEADHRRIAEDSVRFHDALRGVEGDVVMPRTEIIAAGERYVRHQREHMAKEEAEVFPRALAVLTPLDWEVIDAQMAPRADPLFGQFVEEQYRRRYEQILRLIERA
ncbi:MAG: hemerythrin domain-containing protein [Gammaproteobacteria bacterium]